MINYFSKNRNCRNKNILNIKNKVVKYNIEIPKKKIHELESRSKGTTQNAKQSDRNTKVKRYRV